MKYKCPCCESYSLETQGGFEICPVCFWEDDPIMEENPNISGGSNDISLNQAKVNYLMYGACEERFIPSVRKKGLTE